jgi:riboflavin biosynthesis pyrimidine reductase
VSAGEAPRFHSLIPAGAPGETLTAQEALADWREEGDGALRLALNMICSVDGRIAVGGRSAPLSSPADRALFHALRAGADAVMAGATTVRKESYGPIVRSEATRAWRASRGLAEQPFAVIVSRSLDLEPLPPLLEDAGSRVVVITPSSHEIRGATAEVDYIRTATLRAGIEQLASRHGVRTIVCEGGPTLSGSLVAESLLDELFIAISPLLIGDAPEAGAMLMGAAPEVPQPLELRMLLRCDSQLYARYAVRSEPPSTAA